MKWAFWRRAAPQLYLAQFQWRESPNGPAYSSTIPYTAYGHQDAMESFHRWLGAHATGYPHAVSVSIIEYTPRPIGRDGFHNGDVGGPAFYSLDIER